MILLEWSTATARQTLRHIVTYFLCNRVKGMSAAPLMTASGRGINRPGDEVHTQGLVRPHSAATWPVALGRTNLLL